MKQQIRIFLLDSQSIVRLGMRSVFSQENDFNVVGEADCGEEAAKRVNWLRPNVVVMDLMLMGMDGQETIRQIQQNAPQCKIVVLTEFCDEGLVRGAIRAGAIAYLLKDIAKADLVRAVRDAANGDPTLHPDAQRILMRQSSNRNGALNELTERELDILRLLSRGLRNRDIASTLHLTEGTVKGYVSIILSKLQVRDRTQAALLGVRNGLAVAA